MVDDCWVGAPEGPRTELRPCVHTLAGAGEQNYRGCQPDLRKMTSYEKNTRALANVHKCAFLKYIVYHF